MLHLSCYLHVFCDVSSPCIGSNSEELVPGLLLDASVDFQISSGSRLHPLLSRSRGATSPSFSFELDFEPFI